MRHELIRWLEESSIVGDEAFEIALACSEACANAVEHPLDARVDTFEVRAEISDRRVEIEVRDFGQWSTASPQEEGGRGLSIIQTLMDGVVIAHGDGGTSVTMWRRRGGIRTPAAAH